MQSLWTHDLAGAEPEVLAAAVLPVDHGDALLVGRVWRVSENATPAGPSPVLIRDGDVLDLSSLAPTCAQLLSRDGLAQTLRDRDFPRLGEVGEILKNSFVHNRLSDRPYFLAPCDLQPVKACGVTYIQSLLERLVEERSGGNPSNLAGARAALEDLVGGSLLKIVPGSAEASALKAALIASGHWSHYLEVAIGPDAESFSKCPPMAAVGFGADVGVRSDSAWNNPEPELVLAITPDGQVVGASLGNDVNLRDFEGRSPMLLDKAKDNNASAAIGPFIRLFDASYRLADAAQTDISCVIEGAGDFVLRGGGSVSTITRGLSDLVRQVMGRHHQYPDGLILFTGTMWAPNDDRLAPNGGFCHLEGDWVTVSAPKLGRLVNRTRHAHDCSPWTFGLGDLFTNLAKRGMIEISAA